MSSPTGAPATLATADRCLVLVHAVWGDRDDPAAPLRRLAPRWRERIRADLAAAPSPSAARSQLAAEHRTEALPDLGRIHVSWLARALSEESPAIARTALSGLPPALRDRLGQPAESVADTLDGLPHPLAVAWARTLWTERLVGGQPLDNDPLVVRLLTTPAPRAAFRLVVTVGLAKWAYALADPTANAPAPVDLRRRSRERLDALRTTLDDVDPRLARQARRDVVDCLIGQGPSLPRLGLHSVGRLLSGVESRRARWALQHLPYRVAKLIRARMAPSTDRLTQSTLVDWESYLVRLAREQLAAEGRLSPPRDPA